MIPARALHFVFKIAERKETMKFYREILGMKVGLSFHMIAPLWSIVLILILI